MCTARKNNYDATIPAPWYIESGSTKKQDRIGWLRGNEKKLCRDIRAKSTIRSAAMDKTERRNGVEEYLYDPRLLERIAESKNGILVRPLSIADYDRGFIQVLAQLTKVGDIGREQFIDRFRKMKASGDYYVIVAEDQNTGKIIASATLLVEQKFIHNCALRGRLEDVVVNDKYRGKSLGQLMVRSVSLLAQRLRCYKLSLDCKDSVVNFYERLGFTKEPANGNSLNVRYDLESPTSNL